MKCLFPDLLFLTDPFFWLSTPSWIFFLLRVYVSCIHNLLCCTAFVLSCLYSVGKNRVKWAIFRKAISHCAYVNDSVIAACMHAHFSTSPLVKVPLFSLLPGVVTLRIVGNPLTGSFDAASRDTDPNGGCWVGTRSVVVGRSLGIPRADKLLYCIIIHTSTDEFLTWILLHLWQTDQSSTNTRRRTLSKWVLG